MRGFRLSRAAKRDLVEIALSPPDLSDAGAARWTRGHISTRNANGTGRCYAVQMVRPARDHRNELYEEYQQLPRHLHGEIVNGTLYVMSRPSPRHANAASALNAELGSPFQRGRGGPGGWWILFEPELQLVEKEPLVPDLAGWRLERMPELPETAYFPIRPDWVCEVLSKSTERLDREEKLPYYAKHGVRHVWLVDPIAKQLEVYALDDRTERWRDVRTYPGDSPVRAAPFDAIELDLAVLWSAPKP